MLFINHKYFLLYDKIFDGEKKSRDMKVKKHIESCYVFLFLKDGKRFKNFFYICPPFCELILEVMTSHGIHGLFIIIFKKVLLGIERMNINKDKLIDINNNKNYQYNTKVFMYFKLLNIKIPHINI